MSLVFQYTPSIDINYEVHGTSGPVLIMIHGFGASLETWRDIVPLMAPYCKLYLLDLKGFGKSSKPDDKCYSISDQARIVSAFIVQLGEREISLVGHSYGGAVSLMTYLELVSQPDSPTVKRMVLIDSPGYPQPLPFFITILRTPVLNRISMNFIPARLRAELVLRRVIFDKSRITRELVDRYARYFNLPGCTNSFIALANQVIPPNPGILSKRIPEISVPTLILWGAHDPTIERWQAERLNREIRGSRLTIFPKCGHIPQEECPDETAASILEFVSLSGQVSPLSSPLS
jgi:pimeloyl-ACP methyl ester carboxylesterase